MSMNIREVRTKTATKHEVRWSYYDDDGKRHEKSKRFNTRAQAERFKHKTEATKRDEPATTDDGKRTMSYWADAWLVHREEQVQTKRIRPSSLYSSRMVVRQTIKPMLGEKRIRSMTVDDVDQFIAHVQIERGVTVGTAKQHYNVLRQVLAFAVRKGAIRVNPAAGVRRDWTPAVDHEPFQSVALTHEEIACLAKHVETKHLDAPWALMVRFMAYTGLRAGEVAGLDVGDLRLLGTKRGEVHVRQIRTNGKGNTLDKPNRPKTGKTRSVPLLPKTLREDMAVYLRNHPHRDDPTAPLWPGTTAVYERDPITKAIAAVGSRPDYDKAWNRDPFHRRVFKPALQAAGLPSMRLHDLRHTAGSIMLSEGYPDWKVAKWLGHDVGMLHRIYAHILDSDWAEDMDRFDESSTRMKDTVVRLA